MFVVIAANANMSIPTRVKTSLPLHALLRVSLTLGWQLLTEALNDRPSLVFVDSFWHDSSVTGQRLAWPWLWLGQ